MTWNILLAIGFALFLLILFLVVVFLGCCLFFWIREERNLGKGR